jgi:AmiR/NasT family two-component response regulator
VIAISSSGAPEVFRKVAELGAFACLLKPLKPERLVQLVARARARPQPLRGALRSAMGGRHGTFSG